MVTLVDSKSDLTLLLPCHPGYWQSSGAAQKINLFYFRPFILEYYYFVLVLFQQGTPQRLPKRLRFVVDVSGSMYRFNSLDGRLGRMMEAACLVMEAFHQYDNKIKVLASPRIK